MVIPAHCHRRKDDKGEEKQRVEEKERMEEKVEERLVEVVLNTYFL